MGYREKKGKGKRIMELTETLRLRTPSKHNVVSVRTLGHKAISVMYQHYPENQSCSLFSTFLGVGGNRGQPEYKDSIDTGVLLTPALPDVRVAAPCPPSVCKARRAHPRRARPAFWATAGLQETVPLLRPSLTSSLRVISARACHPVEEQFEPSSRQSHNVKAGDKYSHSCSGG